MWATAPEFSTVHGFLTGTIRSPEQLRDDDWRKTEAQAVASKLNAPPAQVGLASLLAQGDDIAPIPAPSASPASSGTPLPTRSS